MYKLFVLLFLVCVCYVLRATAPVPPRDLYDEVRRTCTALDDVISWAKAHHYLLIVDFLFSIRVAQGELELLSTGSSPSTWPSDVTIRVRLIREKLDKLAELAFSSSQDVGTKYFEKFAPLVEAKYYISTHYTTERHLAPVVHTGPVREETKTFTEDASDNCMVEVLGSKKIPKCTISRACFKQMTDENSEDYQLTHQLLWLILAQVKGCRRQLDLVARSYSASADSLLVHFLHKTHQRMPSVLESERFDLFAEMVMVGQMLNYQDFFDPRIVELLHLWQDTTGCYNDESFTSKRVQNETNILRRKLFADELVDDSCSEHMTALSLIILIFTLRYQLAHTPTPAVPWTPYWPLYGILALLGLWFGLKKLRRRRFRILGHFLA